MMIISRPAQRSSKAGQYAAVAQLVEHNVANVVVVSSNLISRSSETPAKPSVSRGFFRFWSGPMVRSQLLRFADEPECSG